MVEQIAPEIRQEINARLAAIEANEDVRILLAVESGSRAWGFPSPDSDYDVRFVYVRPRNWYLRLEPGRDVIGAPIEDDIDLHGWDLRKAILLGCESNGSILEWARSPIQYVPETEQLAEFRGFLDRIYDPRRLALHHRGIISKRMGKPLKPTNPSFKSLMYGVRSALTIRALRMNPIGIPPIDVDELLHSCYLSDEEIMCVDQLLTQKRMAMEIDPAPDQLDDLRKRIFEESAQVEQVAHRRPAIDMRDAADKLFVSIVSQ